MQSVFTQSYTDYEYIIIDGGSTDGSKEAIEKFSDKISYWVSVKDKGIYNAMNKGIVQAKGQYLLFLNSGDYLISKDSLTLFQIEDHQEDILCADIKIIEKNYEWVKAAPEFLSFKYFIKDTLPHQSALIKKTLFEQCGLYDESLKIVGDWKFYVDALGKYQASYRRADFIASVYINNGISSQPENLPLLNQERIDVLKRDYAIFYSDYLEWNQVEARLRFYENSRIHRAVKRLTRFFKKMLLLKSIRKNKNE